MYKATDFLILINLNIHQIIMNFFSYLKRRLPVDTTQIEQAISHLEQQTSAELRVVVERKAKGHSALERAEQLFDELAMHNTAERNAVLIYLAFKPHYLAVVGDVGIHQRVPDDFWQGVYQAMKIDCQNANYTEALCQGIALVGAQLSVYFPRTEHDQNELPNEVVIK